MTYNSDKPIGVFDSGIGGLTVASELHRQLPGEDIIYLGDTARVPYGTKSARIVSRYALECTLFLFNRGVKLVVAACNTASAIALADMKELLRIPLVGVVEPGVKAALAASEGKYIGIIGTPATVKSGAYQNLLRELSPDCNIMSKACPLLVPMAEEGRIEGEIAEAVIREYTSSLLEWGMDTMVMGCTHYPLFRNSFSRVFDGKIELIDSAKTAAEEVGKILLRDDLLKTHGKGEVSGYFTDIPDNIDNLSKLFFRGELTDIALARLGD